MQQLRYCPHCHCHVTPKRIIFAELISSDLARGFALMGIIVGLFRGGALAGLVIALVAWEIFKIFFFLFIICLFIRVTVCPFCGAPGRELQPPRLWF